MAQEAGGPPEEEAGDLALELAQDVLLRLFKIRLEVLVLGALGALDLDLPERKIILKPDGTVDRVHVPERLDAHKLIEEAMLAAKEQELKKLSGKLF